MAESTRTHKVLRNSIAMTLATTLTLLMGFVVIPIAIDRVGLALWGVWVILSGVLSYFSLFDLGVGGTFVTQLAMAATRRDHLTVRQIATISLLLYAVMAALLSPAAAYVAPHLGTWFHLGSHHQAIVQGLFWWVYGYLFLSQGFNVFPSLLVGLQRLRLVSIANVITQIIYYTILLVALSAHQGLYSFILANYLSWGAATIFYIILTSLWTRGIPLSNPFQLPAGLLKTMLSFGGWLQINRLSNQINNETDRILIGIYVNTAVAGIYQLGNKLSQLSRRFPLNFASALLPVFSVWEAEEQSQGQIRRHYVDASRYLALATFFLAGLITATSSSIMLFWLNHRYHQFFLIVVLLLLSYSINNLTGIGTTFLRGIGKPRLESYYAMVGSTLKLGLSIALAPHFGLFGILLGTTIGTILGSLYFLWLFFRTIALTWWHGLVRWLIPLVIATIPPVILVHWLTHWALTGHTSRVSAFLILVLTTLVYSVSFLIMLRVTHFYSPHDEERLTRLLPARGVLWMHRLHLIPPSSPLSRLQSK